ncbi:hypothetical protein VA596_25665 [Amycolatopsis sp., V23-08]|uniref:Uncharacterized protein n=1 Tax=Amycolatopsis heterodermiae TaxID=3110235 RepID=A0ABU5R9Y8_9PSEU|nr:hypothetical protein [Amycolatopsis sp., V23-08]MEA5362943.1 hypothetical protein [Amycolatopsis sp., V23-08]
MAHAGTATTILAATHRATEEYLRERDVPHVLLRNSWYLENYTATLPSILRHGAVALTTEGHTSAVYELGGDEAFTLAELAATVSAATGEPVAYTDLPAGDLTEALIGAGLPAELANVLTDADLGLGRGELFTESGDLSRLIGRPATALATAIADALR